MLTVVLAETAVELVPPELVGAPSVKSRARQRRRAPEHLLLDQAVDHRAMRGLAEGDRRGRPDILHVVTLLLQDSPLASRSLVRLLVHTQDDALIRVRRDLRPPRSQAKFYQLLEDLLRQGFVPEGLPLLSLERGRRLGDILQEEARGPVVLLDEGGAPARSPDFARLVAERGEVTLVLGGFPRGAWRARPPADLVWSVAREALPAWSALVPALAGAEDALVGSQR